MELPKYLYAENKTELGTAQLIISTEVPFFYAQVFKGVDVAQINELCQQHKAIAAGKPYDYRVGIIVLGALHSSLFVSDMKQYAKDLARIGREMSDFYLEEKIKPNEKYYARYKEN